MQPTLRLSLSALLLLSPLSFSTANELLSCVEVDCPTQGGSADCRVANQTFTAVGLTSISISKEIFEDQNDDVELTWTVGLDHHDNVDPDDRYLRYIERVYYLGTPPTVDLTAENLEYGGCALYMTKEGNKNIFHSNNVSPDSSPAFCHQNLGDDCISALDSKISSLAGEHRTSASEADICSSIASSLQENLPSSCTALLTSNSNNSLLVRGVPLTGSQAPSPLSEAQNSSSNCYPTLPKSNNLTRVFAYNISASQFINETAPAIQGETPIWSLFWSKSQSEDDNDDAQIEDPTVQMVCLRTIDRTTASEETRADGGGAAAASFLYGSSGALSVWGTVVSVGTAMFSFGML
ncbi:hypothetical protein AJ80_07834 [Polytolypa hystricis UAMH7299]|uniref:Uncharacterized protein n=1 Tax=Polytolypa hystricis (strain UAMH7299) TaxID=1447883 RepID=A0A2B7XA41_POLH7|nr:hypothetical protein AJ80_07834 [Polytolypa hystricis UAMH7299]